MHVQAVRAAIDLVLFHLADVVRHVVHELELPRSAEAPLEDAPCEVQDELAVAPAEVGGRTHGGQVVVRELRAGRRVGQLAVGETRHEIRSLLLDAPQEVRAHLVAEAAAPRVDHESHLPGLVQTERGGGRCVDDLVHALYLDEVVAGPESAQLPDAALACLAAHGLGSRRAHAAPLLASVGVRGLGVAALQAPAHTALEEGVEVRGREADGGVRPETAVHVPEEVLEEVAQLRLHLLVPERADGEAHPAVDVVADATRRDAALAGVERRHEPHGEAVALVCVGHEGGVAADAGQRRDVSRLLEAAVARQRVEQLPRREDDERNAHVARCRKAPREGSEALRFEPHGRTSAAVRSLPVVIRRPPPRSANPPALGRSACRCT